jgi:hypothetical protein
MPESVQFLAVGRADRIAIVHTLAKLNPTRAAQYGRVRFSGREVSTASVSLLLASRYRRTTLATCSPAFFVLFGVYGLTGWVRHAGARRRLAASFDMAR